MDKPTKDILQAVYDGELPNKWAVELLKGRLGL